MTDARGDDSIRYDTAPESPSMARMLRARKLRRIALAALVLVLIAALAGALGVRTATVTASGGGFTLTVTYASVTRPGLATPWGVEVHHPGGFRNPVTVQASTDHLDMFDENGLDPDPSASTADPRFVEWDFDPPSGERLAVSFDARLEPGVQWGRSGVVRVMVRSRPVVQAAFKTWVVP